MISISSTKVTYKSGSSVTDLEHKLDHEINVYIVDSDVFNTNLSSNILQKQIELEHLRHILLVTEAFKNKS